MPAINPIFLGLPDLIPLEANLAREETKPVSDIKTDTNLFPDAVALLVPTTEAAHWMTMGDPNNPIEAVLWKANKDKLLRVDAKGFGGTVRSDAPESWTAKSKWENGTWTVEFTLKQWPALSQLKKLALAVWRGTDQDRGGIKSVSSDWITV